MMIASAASSSSASSSFCATARVGRFDDGVFGGRKKMSSSSSSSSSSKTRRRRGANAVLAKGGEGQIVVIGANGKTGKRCVKYAAENGWDVVAATRNGSFPSLTSDIKEEARGRVTTKQCSVTSSMAEITNAIDGAESVIFAASSSKDGGSPQEIDRDGCIKVARACLSSKSVKRYVVVTSGAVSKPYSPVYIFLNLFGGIMRAKIEGEDAVRALYYEREDDFYTIVRPGGLTEDPPRGVSACELNQGDDVSGRVSREDVAAVCVECLKRDDAKNATFELYYRDTGKPMAEVFASNANKETDGGGRWGREEEEARPGTSYSPVWKRTRQAFRKKAKVFLSEVLFHNHNLYVIARRSSFIRLDSGRFCDYTYPERVSFFQSRPYLLSRKVRSSRQAFRMQVSLQRTRRLCTSILNREKDQNYLLRRVLSN